jgi:competence ComEA-like helix-hairpin-helix protein
MQTRRLGADEARVRASIWLPSLLTGVALLASVWGLCPPAPSLGAALPCANAQLIEGELRCDDELLHDVSAHCPAAPSRALGPGDALDLGACVCAADPMLRQIGFGCATSSIARMPPEQLAALEQRVDLNTASATELASLAGIGPKLAERIIAGRPYASVDALLDVKGIGEKRLAAIRPRARAPALSRAQ